MDRDAIVAAFADVFDEALLFHRFTDYARDYELVFSAERRYVFRYCVEATVVSALAPETWRVSLDDALTDVETGVLMDGHVWGVRFQGMYPGAALVDGSARAEKWQQSLGIPFYEAVIETNVQRISLVFSDLLVESVV